MNLDCNYTPLIGPIKQNITNKSVRPARLEETFCPEKIQDAINAMYKKGLEKDWQGVYPTIRYYEEAVKFPTKARLFFNDIISGKIIDNLADAYLENASGKRSAFKEFLDNQRTFVEEHAKCNEHSIVQESKGKFIDRLCELYPRSYAKREAIIKQRGVVLDETVPKFKGLRKFLLKQEVKRFMKILA